jgi:glyoxylase-like metal-dependent hydrolase (beta-lactamase superfamily II)
MALLFQEIGRQRMTNKKYDAIPITHDFYQLGTPSYPAYLSMGNDAMIIEGGTGSTYSILVDQIEQLRIPPERIKYVALTHTHPDHIGAVPHLKKIWPHLKVIGSPMAATLLRNEVTFTEFVKVDTIITEISLIKGEIAQWPPEFEDPSFDLDMIVKEGDSIDLGAGVEWKVLETPGHAPCHASYYNKKQDIVTIGDATGAYVPEAGRWWPNYFESLQSYCNSIRKIAALNAKFGALSHNGVIRDWVKEYLQKAMKATEDYHHAMLARVTAGEDPKQVGMEMARQTFTFTNMQPFEVIHGLTRLMLKRSQAAAEKDGLFNME